MGGGGILALPWLVDSYALHIASMIAVFIVAAVGMNILVGLAGLVSLGHAGFFAIGAYTSAMLATQASITFWLSSLAGLALAAATGAVLPVH